MSHGAGRLALRIESRGIVERTVGLAANAPAGADDADADTAAPYRRETHVHSGGHRVQHGMYRIVAPTHTSMINTKNTDDNTGAPTDLADGALGGRVVCGM
jgi:hypothetical protein